jgi:hypothetical protein
MALHAAVARDVRARLGGGTTDHSWLRDQGIARPGRFASVFAPLLAQEPRA